MSINLIPFPNPAPIGISDWEDIIDVTEALSLGINNPADYDFSGDTIKQGVVIMIGGSVYQTTTAEAITGTPSEYVRITPSGSTATALYVASLAGVTWNGVYNFYQDGSGYAYLFNEAKANLASPKTVVGKFAEDAYIGTLTTRGQTILARDGDTGVVIGTTVGQGTLTVYATSADQTTANISDAGSRTGLLNVYSGSAAGSGGAITFGAKQSHIANTVGFAAIKGLLFQGGTNSSGHLAFSTRQNITDTSLTEAMRIVNTGNLILGTTVDSGPRFVVAGGVGSLPTISSATKFLLQNNSGVGSSAYFSIISGNAANGRIQFGDAESENRGIINYNHVGDYMAFHTAVVEGMRLTSANHLLVNTNSDLATLHVDGDFRVSGTNGYASIPATGDQLQFSRAGANDLRALTAVGYLRAVTNGRAVSDANANMLFNADQSNNSVGLFKADAGIQTDTISELIATAGITFGNKNKWHQYYKTTVAITQDEWYTNALLTFGITTANPFKAVHGHIKRAGIHYTILSVERVSTTIVRTVVVSSTGVVSDIVANSGTGTEFAEELESMGTLDLLTN